MKLKLTWLMTLLMAFVMQFSYAQEKTITGTVTSAEDGLPLPGVNVIVKGTSRGVQTDFDGKFSIKASEGETIVFSYLGLKTQEVAVGSSNNLSIVLDTDTQSLEEVVVRAYGTTTSARTTEAISTLSGEAIVERANVNAIQSLQGQIAGVNISTGSGQPGSDPTILIRGVSSINGDTEPLFIVDGQQVTQDNFRSINPNDIETFSVLKDAGATALYGNRASNGVVLITTKRAQFDQGLSFRYSTNYGITELQDANIELMNSREILTFQRNNGANSFTDAEINALANQADTYWTDVFFRKGTTVNHDLQIASGNETTSNLVSMGYTDQEGIFRSTNFQRFSIRNNFNAKSRDGKFTMGLNLSIAFSETNELDNAGSGSIFFNPFTQALSGLPYLSPYDADGSITMTGGIRPGDFNAVIARNAPYVLLNSVQMNTDEEQEIRMLGSFNARYNFAKNLTAGINISGDFVSVKFLELLHPESLLGPFQADFDAGTQTQAAFGGLQQEDYSRVFRFTNTLNLEYSNVFADKHSVTANAFMEYYRGFSDSFGFDQFGLNPRVLGTDAAFIDGNTQEDFNGNGVLTNPYVGNLSSGNASTGLFSVFGTLDYDFDNRYGFRASIRNDKTFRFDEEFNSGIFWSVSGRWNISNEAFMEGSVFNNLKLRASYGEVGNQNIAGGEFAGLTVPINTYTGGGGYNNQISTVPSSIAVTDAEWETTTQLNVGLDFGLWRNRISGEFDVYRNETEGLFGQRSVSLVNATSAVTTNIAGIENKGFEATLNFVVVDNEELQIRVGGNVGYNQNEVTELGVQDENGINFTGGSSALAIGQPFNAYYVVEYAGVNPSNGNPLFFTADGNLTEILSDADRKFSGQTVIPEWTGGFTTRIDWKGFDLSTQWSWVGESYRNNLDLANLEESQIDTDFNRARSMLNAWTTPGDITSIPRVNSALSSVDYINSTDRYLQNTSFLRMRNITLGYTFDAEVMERLPFSSVRFYVQGENLLTFTEYEGWDPEGGLRTTDRGQYPTPKIYTFGAIINF